MFKALSDRNEAKKKEASDNKKKGKRGWISSYESICNTSCSCEGIYKNDWRCTQKESMQAPSGRNWDPTAWMLEVPLLEVRLLDLPPSPRSPSAWEWHGRLGSRSSYRYKLDLTWRGDEKKERRACSYTTLTNTGWTLNSASKVNEIVNEETA